MVRALPPRGCLAGASETQPESRTAVGGPLESDRSAVRLGDVVETELLERHRGLLLAGDLDEIADERREALHLVDEIAEQLLSLDGIRRLPALEELEIC